MPPNGRRASWWLSGKESISQCKEVAGDMGLTLGRGAPLEKDMATDYSILGHGEFGGLHSVGSQ